MKVKNDIEQWSIEKSRALYGIDNWGSEYFGINEQGNITVAPNGAHGPKIDLYRLVQDVEERDIVFDFQSLNPLDREVPPWLQLVLT